MDFTLTDDQTAIVELAARILGDRCSPEALAAAEAAGDRFDAELWRLLAEADLLGLVLPEADGGGGYGVLEAALLCQEVGRTAAPVPAPAPWARARAQARPAMPAPTTAMGSGGVGGRAVGSGVAGGVGVGSGIGGRVVSRRGENEAG